jgi:hypothetical protein
MQKTIQSILWDALSAILENPASKLHEADRRAGIDAIKAAQDAESLKRKDKAFRWTVEFTVAELWVEDGFNLTDSRALDMLANDLRWANEATELGARVIDAPSDARIAKTQGYASVAAFRAANRRG